MIHEKTEFSQLDAPFAEKKVDILNGDVVEILSEGQERPDRFNPGQNQTVIKIKTRNGARYMNLNAKSINIMIEICGSNDDKAWIGSKAKVLLNPTVIGGKKVIVAYLAGLKWELDEYGEPYDPEAVNDQGEGTDELPTINQDDDINVDDIPFD